MSRATATPRSLEYNQTFQHGAFYACFDGVWGRASHANPSLIARGFSPMFRSVAVTSTDTRAE